MVPTIQLGADLLEWRPQLTPKDSTFSLQCWMIAVLTVLNEWEAEIQAVSRNTLLTTYPGLICCGWLSRMAQRATRLSAMSENPMGRPKMAVKLGNRNYGPNPRAHLVKCMRVKWNDLGYESHCTVLRLPKLAGRLIKDV
jgi:hypothetical protein